MKKNIAMLIIFTLCLSLCACGADVQQSDGASVQNKPVNSGKTQNAVSDEVVEDTEAVEETYPWEAEFREEDYYRLESGVLPNGDEAVTWLEGEFLDRKVRELYTWGESGDVRDTYFYPNGNISHEYMRYADGTFQESHYLDNEQTESEQQVSQQGTRIYLKQVNPDDSWYEYHYNENEVLTLSASMEANGTYSESYYFEDGNIKKSVSNNDQTGAYMEYEYYENGSMKRSVYKDSAAGTYTEQECFENGSMKYNKNESAEYAMEDRFDEEGYHTYYCYKNPEYELELIADETGKLVKVIENGEVKEDEETLAQCAQTYKFRQ